VTSKQEIIATHHAFPDWTAPMIGQYCGCHQAQVRAITKRAGIALPKGNPSNSEAARARQIVAEAKKSGKVVLFRPSPRRPNSIATNTEAQPVRPVLRVITNTSKLIEDWLA